MKKALLLSLLAAPLALAQTATIGSLPAAGAVADTDLYEIENAAGESRKRTHAEVSTDILADVAANYQTIAAAAAALALKQDASGNLDTWAGIAPSANAQAMASALSFASMRTLLDLEEGTDFYSIAAANALFDAKAPLASPALTGDPTVPTASAGDNDTSAASTAYVQGEIADMVVSDPTGVTGADAITNIISLTQAEYDAIGAPDAATLYIITD